MEAYDGWSGAQGAPEVISVERTSMVMGDPLRLYCIVSKEAFDFIKRKGATGKGHAQSGHAWLHAYWDAEAHFPEAAADYRASPHAFKITLKAADEAELRAIYEAHAGVCGRTLVEDAGFTVFDGPTVTCVGLGPVRRSQLLAGAGDLKPF